MTVATTRHNSFAFLPLPENALARAALALIFEGEASLAYIYGAAGVGKSHLIASFVADQSLLHPRRVLATTAARLAADIDAAVAPDDSDAFDTLVVEDLAGATNKPRTQRLLEEMIDRTLAGGGRVVLSGPRTPGRVGGLTRRLADRCRGGAVAGIDHPGSESRMLLLRHFAEQREFRCDDAALQLLGERLEESPRALLGALAQLEAQARHGRQPSVTVDAVARYVAGERAAAAPTLHEIARAVSRQFGVPRSRLRSSDRRSGPQLARHAAMWLARRTTPTPLKQIAGYFGRRNHSTVLHACKKVDALLESDPQFRALLQAARREAMG